ncbi:MAG: potassium channel family protein [Bacteroidetes bacterium]|nr:potassium channel family protein [Bacteroidota bacterium]
MSENNTKYEKQLGILNLLVIILTFYVLGAIVVDTIYPLDKETSTLLHDIDIAICIFFLGEFSVRFYRAENKWKFMKWGWIDLLSSIPMIEPLRAGRMLRLFRLLRIVRAFRSTHHLVHHVFKNKIKGTLTSAVIFAVLIIIFSSIAILQVEHHPNSNILTAEDALWWAYVTITTVGYGDLYPVTTEGRIIAALLMTTGVGLFGTFTAYVSSLYVISQKKDEENGDR